MANKLEQPEFKIYDNGRLVAALKVDYGINIAMFTNIYVPSEIRGMGFGTRLMNLAIKTVEGAGYCPTLLCEPSEEDKRERLATWFRKFGFVGHSAGQMTKFKHLPADERLIK